MPIKLKLYLGRKVIDSLSKTTKLTTNELLPLMQVSGVNDKFSLNLPMNILEDHVGVPNVNEIQKIQPDDIIKGVTTSRDRANRKITFEIDRSIFIQDVMENCFKPNLNEKPKTIVVEFSSPNIAKPFHMGHLRSTIIGNFISNLNCFINHKVTKLNYLGDWGTQFGFIKVGVDMLNYSSDAIKSNPLKLLYESYVHANKHAQNDPQILEKAKLEFNKLESGSSDTSYWKDYINFSKQELKETYKRLGVVFDEYNYESMYSAKEIQTLIDSMVKNNIVEKLSDGKLVAKFNETQQISVMKSDGSTLYIARDIAAAIDRFNRYNFDRMYYVVDNAQSDHFNALKGILHKMKYIWSDRLHHVKFGRIRGMSSRKGTSVFLTDILDECKDLMIKKQIESPTTKVSIDNGNVSDILGVSCVIVNDLKQRRQRDYEFSWDRVLQVQGDTGIKLQYTHCRLHSLERNSGAIAASKCVPELLSQQEATLLILEMARFNEIVYRCNEQLEACILVNYLFHLCNHINKALKVLQVKGSPPEIASQRMLLFQTAREVLGVGMSIIGLQPLKEM